MRSTRNSCVYLTHSLRRSRKLPLPRSRYHTSTLLKNAPGAKPRLQHPHTGHSSLDSSSSTRREQTSDFHSQSGGAERDRTADLLRARQALSQLSYSPRASARPVADASARAPFAPTPPLDWWVWVDSNHRPHPYQGCALTT